jgi:predicted small lipoprotein YifL
MSRTLMMSRALLPVVVVSLAGCGATGPVVRSNPSSATPQARPQVIEPAAGVEPAAATGGAPVGDVNPRAPSLAEVKQELRLEVIAARVTTATYIDPLQYVTVWERTDQGVDANLPVGAPILAPCRVKVLAIIPDWYAGQPLVYFELLDGPDAGKVQYVSEEITGIAPAGNILQQGQAIARYAASGTGIEYGWSTVNGVTLARATTGYEEGQVTPAGQSIRAWLNSLGANAGSG